MFKGIYVKLPGCITGNQWFISHKPLIYNPLGFFLPRWMSSPTPLASSSRHWRNLCVIGRRPRTSSTVATSPRMCLVNPCERTNKHYYTWIWVLYNCFFCLFWFDSGCVQGFQVLVGSRVDLFGAQMMVFRLASRPAGALIRNSGEWIPERNRSFLYRHDVFFKVCLLLMCSLIWNWTKAHLSSFTSSTLPSAPGFLGHLPTDEEKEFGQGVQRHCQGDLGHLLRRWLYGGWTETGLLATSHWWWWMGTAYRVRDQSDPNKTRLVEICSRKKKIELEGRGMLERFFFSTIFWETGIVGARLSVCWFHMLSISHQHWYCCSQGLISLSNPQQAFLLKQVEP